MAYTGYATEEELRQKLGNTIAGNFDTLLLANARKYGDGKVDVGTQKIGSYPDVGEPAVIHAWTPTDQYYSLAKTISMEFSVAWLRSTQINVSIQALREYTQAERDLEEFYKLLVSVGLVNLGGRIHVDEFVTDVLNPITGTRVTGLHGIVRSRRNMTSWEEALYHP
jgi:hypothetical protein